METSDVQKQENLSIGEKAESDSRPPLFGSWKRMYLFVLFLHALVIAALFIFTKTLS